MCCSYGSATTRHTKNYLRICCIMVLCVRLQHSAVMHQVHAAMGEWHRPSSQAHRC